jgi:hypothetical protein
MNFDFLNNKICPFCQNKLEPDHHEDNWSSRHLYCQKHYHFKIMTSDNDPNVWELFRIYGLYGVNLVGWNENPIEMMIETSPAIIIPNTFNPFQFSLEEISNKLKLYMTFS